MNASGLPILPLKFLFAVDITFSPSPGTPWCPDAGSAPGTHDRTARLDEDRYQSLLESSQHHLSRSGGHYEPDPGGDLLPLQDLRSRAQVREPPVRTCPDETLSNKGSRYFLNGAYAVN